MQHMQHMQHTHFHVCNSQSTYDVMNAMCAIHNMHECTHENHMLLLDWQPSCQQSSELASIVYKSDFVQPSERTLCVYRTSDQFYNAHLDLRPLGHSGYFLPMHHPLADAMQYPLLFWGGHKDSGYCRASEIEHAKREQASGRSGHIVSMLEHTRYRLLAPEQQNEQKDCLAQSPTQFTMSPLSF